MLDKLMKDLNEMNRLAQVYYENEQWALLDMVMGKIKNYTILIGKSIENSEISEDEQILS